MPVQTTAKNFLFPDGVAVSVKEYGAAGYTDLGAINSSVTNSLSFDENQIETANAGTTEKQINNMKVEGGFTLVNWDMAVIEKISGGVLTRTVTLASANAAIPDQDITAAWSDNTKYEIVAETSSTDSSNLKLPSQPVFTSVTLDADGTPEVLVENTNYIVVADSSSTSGWSIMFISSAMSTGSSVDGSAATAGIAEVSSSVIPFVGVTVPALTSGTYDIDITADGGSLGQLNFTLSDTDDWDDIAALIETALQTETGGSETVTIANGKILVTSDSTGASSDIVIADGTADTVAAVGPLLIQITNQLGLDMTLTLDSPVDGAAAAAGYHSVSSSSLQFVGATVPALTAGTYDIDVTSDGGALGQLNVTIAATETWTEIAALIQAALRTNTSGTETVTIAGGRILVTSDTTGTDSSILIADGTAATVGAVGPLLAQITSQVSSMTTSIGSDTPKIFAVTLDYGSNIPVASETINAGASTVILNPMAFRFVHTDENGKIRQLDLYSVDPNSGFMQFNYKGASEDGLEELPITYMAKLDTSKTSGQQLMSFLYEDGAN